MQDVTTSYNPATNQLSETGTGMANNGMCRSSVSWLTSYSSVADFVDEVSVIPPKTRWASQSMTATYSGPSGPCQNGTFSATKTNLIEYLTARTLVRAITADPQAGNALDAVKGILRAHTFYIRLDKVTGNRRPAEDSKLLAEPESGNTNQKATAILETIYQVRCNMFHGHKNVQAIQRDLLVPIIVLLETVINVTEHKLRAEP